MKHLILLTATAAIAALAGSAIAAPMTDRQGPLVAQAAAQVPTSDFVQKVAVSDMFEVEASKLALERSKDPGVRAFAREMIHDHMMTSQKLKETLSSAHVDVSPPTALDDAHAKLMARLREVQKGDFDRTYMTIQAQGHEEALHLLAQYSQDGDNGALKDVAAQTVPMVEKHLAAAQKITQVAKRT